MKISTKGRWIFWAVFIGGGIALSVLTDSVLRVHGFNVRLGLPARLPGIVLLFVSMIVARNTGKILAKYGKEGDIPRFETNKLVEKGPYSCMRHPMHLGLILFPFSIAMIIGSFSYVFIYAPLNALIIVIMVFTIEEKEAIEKFGAEYLEYKKRVPAFNLSPGCLKKLFVCCS